MIDVHGTMHESCFDLNIWCRALHVDVGVLQTETPHRVLPHQRLRTLQHVGGDLVGWFLDQQRSHVGQDRSRQDLILCELDYSLTWKLRSHTQAYIVSHLFATFELGRKNYGV